MGLGTPTLAGTEPPLSAASAIDQDSPLTQPPRCSCQSLPPASHCRKPIEWPGASWARAGAGPLVCLTFGGSRPGLGRAWRRLPPLPHPLPQHLFISHETQSKGPALAVPAHSPVMTRSVAAWPWDRPSAFLLSFPHPL